jgi:hypothetical protein
MDLIIFASGSSFSAAIDYKNLQVYYPFFQEVLLILIKLLAEKII